MSVETISNLFIIIVLSLLDVYLIGLFKEELEDIKTRIELEIIEYDDIKLLIQHLLIIVLSTFNVIMNIIDALK